VQKETPAAAFPSHTKLVFLVSVMLLMNYIDRGNLATAAPLVKTELQLDDAQLGLLLSSFYWTYVAFMIPVGWATERFGAHRVLAVGATLWSLATLLTGFAPNLSAIFLLRLLLGAAESTVFPAVSSLIATHVPLDKRGMANGIMSFGYQVGPAVGTFAGGLLMESYGWRPVFILFGAISLVWVLPWLRFSAGHTPAPRSSAADGGAPTYGQILRQRGLWGASLGHFSSNYNWYFILSFLPLYLVEERGFSMSEMGQVAGSAYLINALAALLGGWYMDRWVRAGRSRTVIYKFAMTSSHVVSIGAMVGMMLLPVREAIVCLFVFEVFIGLCAPGTFGIGQILAGPLATGRWIGVQNFCGNTAGILAPALTGMMVAASGNYSMAFTVAALVNVLGVIGWGFILPKVEPIDWAAGKPG
jgi:MFS family permease